MYEIKKNKLSFADGIELTTYSREVDNGNVLDVEAGTTGYQDNDGDHRSRTYFRITDAGCTDMQVTKCSDGRGFQVVLDGDCELETIQHALKFITKVIEQEAKGVCD
jgi:hypothetical protein